MRHGVTPAIEERENPPFTAEEIEAFAMRIALLVAKTPYLDALCDSIDELMQGSGRKP